MNEENSMRKKILMILAITVLMLTVLTVSASAAETSGTCGDNVMWTFDDTTGTLTISGEGKMKDYSLGNAPWASFGGKTVAKKIVDRPVTAEEMLEARAA